MFRHSVKLKPILKLRKFAHSCTCVIASNNSFKRHYAKSLLFTHNWYTNKYITVTYCNHIKSEVSNLKYDPARFETDIFNLLKSNEFDSIQILENLYKNHRITPHHRLQLLNELWLSLNKTTLLIDERHFNIKLQCYLKCHANIVPKLFLKEVKEAGVEPTQSMLKLLLAVVAQHGDEGYVSSVVTSMKSRNYTADDDVFSCLVTAYAVRGDMKKARQVLSTMEESNVVPGPRTFTSLMRAAAMMGDYSALHTFRTMAEDSGIVLSEENILSVAETAALYGKEYLLLSLESNIDSCSTSSIITLAESLLYSGHVTTGYLILKHVKVDQLRMFCQEFIQNMFAAKTPASEIINVCKKIVADDVYDRALYDIFVRFMFDERCDEATMVLQACRDSNVPIRPHFFWPLIACEKRKNSDEGVLNVLKTMKQLEVRVDAETIQEVVLPRLAIDEGNAIFKRLQEMGGLTVSQLIVPFLAHLLKFGHLRQALQLHNMYSNSISQKDTNVLLLALANGFRISRDHESTIKIMQALNVNNVGDWLLTVLSSKKWLPSVDIKPLLKKLKIASFIITPTDEKIILGALTRNKTLTPGIEAALQDLVINDIYPKTSYIPHPVSFSALDEASTRFLLLSFINYIDVLASSTPVVIDLIGSGYFKSKMDLTELECHLKELKEKGMNTRGVLRRLVQEYCRVGHVTDAIRTYKEMLDQNVALSAGVYAAMMQVNITAKQPEDAMDFLKKLEEKFPDFPIDCYKIVDLATLLVSSGMLDDAVKLINNRPQRETGRRAMKSWERNCWELLNAAGVSGGAPAVQRMLSILLVNNYCVPTNIILGPLIKAHLNSDNTEKLVEEFCRCARMFRKTPLQQEVVLVTLASEDENMLDAVLRASQGVHGLASTQAVLIAALAVRGDATALRQLLQGSSVEEINKQIENHVVRMRDLNQVDALLTLLTASWDLSVVDVDLLVDSILHCFRKFPKKDRKGDVEGAVSCWATLESKGVQLSDKHKNSLATLVAATSKG